jgi:hypothetical protein
MRIAADTERQQIREPAAYRLSISKLCDKKNLPSQGSA